MLSVIIYTYVKTPPLLAEKAQAPGSRNQKDVGQISSNRDLFDRAGMVGYHALRCKKVRLVTGFSGVVKGFGWSGLSTRSLFHLPSHG